MEAPPSLPVKPELRDSFAIVKQQVFAELDSMQKMKTAVPDTLPATE